MNTASHKKLDFGPVSKWFEITVTLTEDQKAELMVFLDCLGREGNRRRFAEKMLPPRGRIPTSPECKRLDALFRVKQALRIPREIPAERAYRRLNKLFASRGGEVLGTKAREAWDGDEEGEAMNDSDRKRIPDILDYGDAHEDFVDELARIDEDGVVSHLIFTRRTRAAHSNSTLERKVIARLIVPTHMVKLMGRLLVDGKCGDAVPMPEQARLY
jgi:hypothetical protein